jgi:WD40 repeat protein
MRISRLRTATVVLLAAGVPGTRGLLAHHQAAQAGQAEASAKRPAARPKAADLKRIHDLIRQLGSEAFAQREAACQGLVDIGEPALELLRQAARDSPDPEVRRRAAQAVQAIVRIPFYEVRCFEGHRNAGLHWVGCVAITPDGRRAVSGGVEALRCWDLQTGKQTLVIDKGKGKGYSCWSLAISRDGRRVLAGGEDAIARLFDLRTGREVKCLAGHAKRVCGVALSADGKQAATGGGDRSILVWDVETGKQLRALGGVREQVRCLALSPDGKLLAAGHLEENRRGRVRLWDLATGQEVRELVGHTEEVTSVAFSPDGKTLLSSSHDQTARLWDVATGQERQRLVGHLLFVGCAAFTPDGRRVVSCGEEHDRTVRIWDVATGKLLAESAPVAEGFLSVAVLPDGRGCVTAGKDRVVRLWRWTK